MDEWNIIATGIFAALALILFFAVVVVAKHS